MFLRGRVHARPHGPNPMQEGSAEPDELEIIRQARAITSPRGAQVRTGSQPAGLDLTQLDKLAEKFLGKSLAQSTQRSHRSGQNHFLVFCQQAKAGT